MDTSTAICRYSLVMVNLPQLKEVSKPKKPGIQLGFLLAHQEPQAKQPIQRVYSVATPLEGIS